LRRPETIKDSTHSIWEITSQGQSTALETLKKAPKQQEALGHFQKKTILDTGATKKNKISPATLKTLTEKQLIEKSERKNSLKSLNTPTETPLLKETPLLLNNEQDKALQTLQYGEFNTVLLDGITGSGKTEVYLQAIEHVLKRDEQVIVLVPEIGLTPQTVTRFEQRFNQTITTLHSGLTDKQRFTIWQKAKLGEINIVIGTRSSIFTPLPRLGLIVVDEEHDNSYKQQEGVRYSARDVAIIRAHKGNIPLILGSATPSLESLQNAISGRYQHRLLRQRAKSQPLPSIECIDTQESDIDEASLRHIQTALEQNQQVLVFINRRGYAPILNCKDCGWTSLCENCDSRMTLHRSGYKQHLHCHHCDKRSVVPPKCPQCHSQRIKPLGSGTQRSEETLEKRFGGVPILRIDRDSMARKGQLEAALAKVNKGEPCILVGTQMLAKGHHFPNLGMGVILGLDQAFFSSDFRGAERMGQLLTQVAGRIGRENHKGKVIIQTRFSDHPLLSLLLNEGYEALAKHLLSERKLTGMPPFEHITLIRCHAQQAQLAEEFLHCARQIAQQIIPAHDGLQYLGPFPATMEKRNNRYHFLLQIKASNRKERQYLLQQLCERLESTKQARGLHWLVDVDAQDF
jgi:primosomal protein N' (replication factor Y)